MPPNDGSTIMSGPSSRGSALSPSRKLLFVSRNLPPIHGGIERLMRHAVDALAADWECHVVGPRGCRPFLPAAAKVTELPAGLPWFPLLALPVVVALAVRHRYRLCVAGNGLVGPL